MVVGGEVMWAQYMGGKEMNLFPSFESKSITNHQDVASSFLFDEQPTREMRGAVRGAEQVWRSHSGSHFCCVATPIDSHSFLTTLAHPPTAGRCDCSFLSPTPLCSLVVFICCPPPPSLSVPSVISASCFWFYGEITWKSLNHTGSNSCPPVPSVSSSSGHFWAGHNLWLKRGKEGKLKTNWCES